MGNAIETPTTISPPLEGGAGEGTYPFFYRWHNADPLPMRLIRSATRNGHALGSGPPWLSTGPTESAFDFCGHVRRLLTDIADRCEDLHHVHVPGILIAVTQARNGREHGLQARVTPLRFPGGKLVRSRRGVPYQVQRYFHGEHEFLYLMTFCLPRFQDQDFDAKFITLFHELYHISPAFNGDLRRHAGRYAIHSHSQCAYDKHMSHLARAYLATKPEPELHAFLRLDFGQLVQRHGAVTGVVVPRPKIVPMNQNEFKLT